MDEKRAQGSLLDPSRTEPGRRIVRVAPIQACDRVKLMLTNEVEHLKGLRHPGLPHLISSEDVGDGEWRVELEAVEGRTIEDYCSESPYDFLTRQRLCLSLFDAVSYLHANFVAGGVASEWVRIADTGTVVLGRWAETHLRHRAQLLEGMLADESRDVGGEIDAFSRSVREDVGVLLDIVRRLLTPIGGRDGQKSVLSRMSIASTLHQAWARRSILKALERARADTGSTAWQIGRLLRRRSASPIEALVRVVSHAATRAWLSIVGSPARVVVLGVATILLYSSHFLIEQRSMAARAAKDARIEQEAAIEMTAFLQGLLRPERATSEERERLQARLRAGLERIVVDETISPLVRSSVVLTDSSALDPNEPLEARMRLMTAAVDLTRRTGPDGEVYLASALTYLAWVYGDAGDRARMEELVVEAQQILARHGGRSNDHIWAHVILGFAFGELGRDDSAQRHLQAAKEIARDLHGEQSIDYARALAYEAGAYRGMNRIDRALRATDESRRARKRALGADHPETVDSEIETAQLLAMSGAASDAEARLRSLTSQVQTRGARYKEGLHSIDFGLGDALWAQGRYQDSLESYRSAIERIEHMRPNLHWRGDTAHLALHLARLGAVIDAVSMLEVATQGLSSDVEQWPRQLLHLRAEVAAIQLETGNASTAETLATEVLELMQRRRDPALLPMARAHLVLATLRRREGKVGAAREHLETARNVQPQGLVYVHRILMAEIEGEEAAILESEGRAAEALQHRQAVVEASTRTFGAAHPEVAEAKVRLAKSLDGAGQREAARALLEEALPVLRAEHVSESPILREAEQLAVAVKR